MENDAIQSDVSAGGNEAELAAMFGDETPEKVENPAPENDSEIEPEDLDEPDEPEIDEPEEDLYEIKVNGKTQKVTQKRLIELAQKADGADKKFEEAAAARKEIEQLKAAIPEQHKKLNEALTHYIKQAEAFMPAEPDWQQLLNADIQNGTRNYELIKFQWEQKQKELAMARNAKAELDQRNEAERVASNQRRLAEEMEKVREAIPAWKDPKRAAEDAQAIGKYLTDAGIPTDVVSNIDDHKILLMARKAMLYDQALARRSQAQNAPMQRVNAERPSVSQNAVPKTQVRRQTAEKAFKENPSTDTLANFFL